MTDKKPEVIVDFSRITIWEFKLFLEALREDDPTSAILGLCDKVVVGGVKGRRFDDLGEIMSKVSEKLQYNMDRIATAIELGRMMGNIDKHLDEEG